MILGVHYYKTNVGKEFCQEKSNMRNYWKSQRNIDLEKRHRENLGLLLWLSNQDVEEKERKKLEWIEEGYEKLLGKKSLDGRRSTPVFLEKLRTHIRGRIESIINASLQLHDEIPLWQVGGVLQIAVTPIGVTGVAVGKDYFTMRFIFGGRGKYARSSLERAKELIDARLTEIVLSLDLKPSRFKKCPECGAYFYQPTSREKNYCSAGCAAKVRKRRFLEKISREKGGDTEKEK
jgi:hypothetical protein